MSEKMGHESDFYKEIFEKKDLNVLVKECLDSYEDKQIVRVNRVLKNDQDYYNNTFGGKDLEVLLVSALNQEKEKQETRSIQISRSQKKRAYKIF